MTPFLANLLDSLATQAALLEHVPALVLVVALGACVGSFVNVVVYRLPRGMSLLNPPSECPACGHRLRFFRENLPVLGWLLLRGKCRWCRAPISLGYLVIETVMAMLFAALYVAIFLSPWDDATRWWTDHGLLHAWPTWLAGSFLLAGLVAMTIIDARTTTIPIQIPLFVTVSAFVLHGVQPLFAESWSVGWSIPVLSWPGCGAAIGGMAGVAVIAWGLHRRILPYSFADYARWVTPGGSPGDYPHARREVLRETLTLMPCLVGVGLGWWLGTRLGGPGALPLPVQAIAASFAGYLVGGGLIWSVRILATLVFGREAMGLGDVHLLAAVGAVLGWFAPVLVFFIAPFLGIAWALGSWAVSSTTRRPRRELPYGPHLALATLLVVLGGPLVRGGWHTLLPGVPMPTARRIVDELPRATGQEPPGAIQYRAAGGTPRAGWPVDHHTS